MKHNIIVEPEGVVFKPLTTTQEKMLREAIQKSRTEEAKKNKINLFFKIMLEI